MTEAHRETLEELLDSIKPEDKGSDTGLHPSKEDPQPTRRMTGNPFDTDNSDPFSDEKSNGSVDRMTDGPFSSDDPVLESQDTSIDTEFPDTNQNRKRQTDTRSRNQGQRRQQQANQQGGVFIYNPQIVVNGSRQQQKQPDLNELNRRIMEGQ